MKRICLLLLLAVSIPAWSAYPTSDRFPTPPGGQFGWDASTQNWRPVAVDANGSTGASSITVTLGDQNIVDATNQVASNTNSLESQLATLTTKIDALLHVSGTVTQTVATATVTSADVAPLASRYNIAIQNQGTNSAQVVTVHVGGTPAVTGQGWKLLPGDVFSRDADAGVTVSYIAASTTPILIQQGGQ